MKKADIKLGVVYAYQRSTYGEPKPLVFLSLDLYRSIYQAQPGHSWCQPAHAGAKPKAGRGYGSTDVGFPVVMVRWNQQVGPRTLAAMGDLGAEVISAGLPASLKDTAETDILTRMASIIGPWDEVMAEREVARQKAQQHQEEQNRVFQSERQMSDAAKKALNDNGVFAAVDPDNHLRLTPHNARKLAELLARVGLAKD